MVFAEDQVVCPVQEAESGIVIEDTSPDVAENNYNKKIKYVSLFVQIFY